MVLVKYPEEFLLFYKVVFILLLVMSCEYIQSSVLGGGRNAKRRQDLYSRTVGSLEQVHKSVLQRYGESHMCKTYIRGTRKVLIDPGGSLLPIQVGIRQDTRSQASVNHSLWTSHTGKHWGRKQNIQDSLNSSQTSGASRW